MKLNNIFLILGLLIAFVAVNGSYADVPTLRSNAEVVKLNKATETDLLVDQFDMVGLGAYTAQNFEAIYDAYDNEAADDFTVPAGEIWTIEQILMLGVYDFCATLPCGPAASVHIVFYNDAAGEPGTVAAGPYDIVPTFDTLGSFILDIASPPMLAEGTYWMGFYANMDYEPYGQWFWAENDLLHGNAAIWRNPGGGFLTPCSDWGTPEVCFATVGAGPDVAYQIYGTSEPATDPCADYTNFVSRCTNDGTVQARVVLSMNTSHVGEIVEFLIDEDSYTAAIVTNGVSSRAQISIGGYTGLSGTVSVVDPAGCFEPRPYACDAASKGNAEWEADDARWAAEAQQAKVAPVATKLMGNYPNPFNPTTSINYALSEDGFVSLKIYNTLGEEVATLVNEYQVAGIRSAVWNGRNESGLSVASGIYIYRLTAGNIVLSEKMLFMK